MNFFCSSYLTCKKCVMHPYKTAESLKKGERHIEKHEVRREEIADALNNFKYVKRKNERFLFYSRTKAGRYLSVVVEKEEKGEYYLITARESTKSEKGVYKKKRK